MATSENTKNRSSRLPLLIIAFLLLPAGGAGGFYYFARVASRHAHSEPEKPRVRAVLHLETFTVNMSDPDQKAFLRLGVDLGLERDPKSSKEGEPPTALVRDTVLSVLMSAKPDDLVPPEGKARLKDQILHAIQNRSPELGVHEVYFTEFLMQR